MELQFLCPSSGVYSLYTRHWCMPYRCVDSFRAGPGWNCVPYWSCPKAVYKPVWHIPEPSVQWINSSRWAEEPPEICRVSCRSKFGKLVHLVGFIIKKFVTMQGHMNVKNIKLILSLCIPWRWPEEARNILTYWSWNFKVLIIKLYVIMLYIVLVLP